MRVRCIVESSAVPPGPVPAPGPSWRARNCLAGRRGSSHLDAAARRAVSPLESAPTTSFALNRRAICLAQVSANPHRAGLPVSHGVVARSLGGSARPVP